MTYYCAVHKDEDHQALQGQKLDPCTNHMVFHTGYDLGSFREFLALQEHLVLWEMESDPTAKFGYKFKNLVGIPA